MNRQVLRIGLAAAGAAAVAATTVIAAQGDQGRDHDTRRVSAFLDGYSETPLALSTPGEGFFRASVDQARQEIRYRLSFGGVPTAVTQAHIHFGSPSQSGGVSVFLCTNLGNGPVGTQACPAAGTITGTIVPADVIGPAGQGIAAGEFRELVDAIEAGAAYVNVHSTQFAGGEIRGQLR
ncbi:MULTISPECIES: CHRD domain-containing protein [unclassified Nocardioides]|uniref:CHRD domain-containing protein n=1 Tax=unclassified Nocardioides TaxID=2615069 RepID=UPI00360E60EA